MRNKNCEVVRRELDELTVGDACSSGATEHLRECASCREFHEQQTKLRQIVGSLGTVEAPADFDFRLRARLANGARNGSSVYWLFTRRGLAVAAMAIVFLVGGVAVRNVLNRPAPVNSVAQQPPTPVVPETTPPQVKEDKKPEQTLATAAEDSPVTRKVDRHPGNDFKKRPMATIDSALSRAEVINDAQAAGLSAAFPIYASNQTFRVSLDDGRGNARTISVPTISFGSQRIGQSSNQLAAKRVW